MPLRPSVDFLPLLFRVSLPLTLLKMGRFKYLVDSPSQIEKFRATYRIPQEVGLKYCPTEGLLTDREVGEIIIPIIAFLEGGMTIPMGPVTRSYLTAHRLSPE